MRYQRALRRTIPPFLSPARGWIFRSLLLGLLLTIQVPGYSQATLNEPTDVPLTAYDEVPMRVVVDGFRMFYVDAIYGSNQQLYVNIEDLFNTLNIACTPSPDGNRLAGFLEKESQIYSVDVENHVIANGSKVYRTLNGLVKEMGSLYLESSLFNPLFGITLSFNFRALTIHLSSNFELPVIKELRLENQRKGISSIKGEVRADTVIKRNYHFFKPGTLDYGYSSYQLWNGPTEHRATVGIGTELLYGEAEAAINYYSQYPFDRRQLYYLWRWIDNDKSLIRQAQVGKISNPTISFINAPIVGGVIRNAPTTVRKASGFYTLTEQTEPNWNVELYINNVLVDFTKSDASGSFTFKVPVVYGYTTLKLKFYGPLGEERTLERTLNTPYTMLPSGEFEYSVAGGILEDSISSRFGRAEFNYGLSRKITLGGGTEYLSSIPQNPYIPFANLTIQPFSRMTFTGEYAHGVRTRGVLDYYIHKDALLELDYAKFIEGQLATRFNAPEERKVKLSIPLKIKKLYGFARLNYNQLVYGAFNYNQGNAQFSAYLGKFSANTSTLVNWISNQPASVLSDLALSYRSNKGWTIRPSGQYNFTDQQTVYYQMALEKYFKGGNLMFSYQRNVLFKDNFLTLNLRFDLPFARAGLSASRFSGQTMTSESLQGSLAFGGGKGYVYGSPNSSSGKGGLVIYPFLDMNFNGKWDVGERLVKLQNVSIMGGKVLISDRDTLIRIPDLNAFTHYLLEFHNEDLPNISWRFNKMSYQVMIDPNQFKRIEVAIVPQGEVSGMVYQHKNGGLRGQKRISVQLYKKITLPQMQSDNTPLHGQRLVTTTLSESDGYLYYMGLEPGEYVATVDPEQLKLLKMTCSPNAIPFTIHAAIEGDVIGGLDFILSTPEDQLQPTADKSPLTNP